MGMANTIKKGESLFIPFKNGESIYDSQLKPRMYKTKEQYDKYSYRFGDAEMVEYVEVVHGRWVYNTDDFTPAYRCSACGYNKPMIAGEKVSQGAMNYCSNCGAKMDGDGNG